MAASTSLSINDSSVLGALFDPEATLSNGAKIIDSTPQGFSEATFSKIQEQEKSVLLPINQKYPSTQDITATIRGLDRIIETHPKYGPAWNNRAQARRMLFSTEQLPNHPVELRNIIDDLTEAISLTTPTSPINPLSLHDARVLASAHTHRAYLLWLASRSDRLATTMTECVAGLQGFDKERLEELASRDFALGGRYGNDTAKQLAVRTNPYAKLCGSIVKEAMQKEIADHYQIPVSRVR